MKLRSWTVRWDGGSWTGQAGWWQQAAVVAIWVCLIPTGTTLTVSSSTGFGTHTTTVPAPQDRSLR